MDFICPRGWDRVNWYVKIWDPHCSENAATIGNLNKVASEFSQYFTRNVKKNCSCKAIFFFINKIQPQSFLSIFESSRLQSPVQLKKLVDECCWILFLKKYGFKIILYFWHLTNVSSDYFQPHCELLFKEIKTELMGWLGCKSSF